VTRRHLIVLTAVMWVGGVWLGGAWLGAAWPDSVTALAAQATSAMPRNPIPVSAESVSTGKALYVRNCAPCHGSSGEGGPGNDLIPAAPDLTDAMWDHGSTDGEIFTNIKIGIAPDFNMTPFKDRLKDDDIWHVVNYLRSIAKK
jgi:cytochrome c oxidase cbb3-type subunit 3